MKGLSFPAVDPLTGAEDKDIALPSWNGWRFLPLMLLAFILWIPIFFVGWLVWTHL